MRSAVRVLAALAMLQSATAGAEELAGYSGAELYKRFCSSCHGSGGEGDGPVASTLRVMVPDLTRLAERRGGEFPADAVRRIVDGREVRAAHGARQMPVWGYEFRAAGTTGEHADALVSRLVDHLRSIQRER
jgi:mono/diheme cytochrome c family protein